MDDKNVNINDVVEENLDTVDETVDNAEVEYEYDDEYAIEYDDETNQDSDGEYVVETYEEDTESGGGKGRVIGHMAAGAGIAALLYGAFRFGRKKIRNWHQKKAEEYRQEEEYDQEVVVEKKEE